MRARGLPLLVLAGLCGFVGGHLPVTLHPANAGAGGQVVRASRFELLNESGLTVAVLGRNQSGETVLAFGTPDAQEGASFGLYTNGSPFLKLAGKDGKVRLILQLGRGDKPFLAMNDEKWEGRAVLGFIDQDTPAGDSRWDQWALLFRSPGSSANLASIGAMTDSKGIASGRVIVRSGRGRTWLAPQ